MASQYLRTLFDVASRRRKNEIRDTDIRAGELTSVALSIYAHSFFFIGWYVAGGIIAKLSICMPANEEIFFIAGGMLAKLNDLLNIDK